MNQNAAISQAEILREDGAQLYLEPLSSLGTQENVVQGQVPFAPPVSSSIKQADFPKDRRAAMMKVASTVIDLGLRTPQELAARLDKLRPDGSLRQYSRAFWRLMSSFDSSLLESPDWQDIYAKMDKSDTFKIGEHQFCEPDYRQIMLWANALKMEPLTVVERLLSGPGRADYCDSQSHFKNRRIIKLRWDMKLLPLGHFEWVDGLVIESIWFYSADASSAIQIKRSLRLPLPQLRDLICDDMNLICLDLSDCPLLTELYCSCNELTELGLAAVPLLTDLRCYWNKLAKLDLSSVPRLIKLECQGNKLTELDLASAPQLTDLNCSVNALTMLDVRPSKKLRDLSYDREKTKLIQRSDQDFFRVGEFHPPDEGVHSDFISVEKEPAKSPKSTCWLISDGYREIEVLDLQEAVSKEEACTASGLCRYASKFAPERLILSLDELPDLLSRGRLLFGNDSKTPEFSPVNVSRCAREWPALRRHEPSSFLDFFSKQRREKRTRKKHCAEVIFQVFDYLGMVEEKERELEKLKKERWLALDGWSFERGVAEVLRKRGYEVQVTRGSNDGGIDLIITRAEASIIAQCKNHAAPVGPAVVRELYGAMISHGASEAWLIASSGVTIGAMNFTEGKPMRIIDLDEIIQWEAAAQKAGR